MERSKDFERTVRNCILIDKKAMFKKKLEQIMNALLTAMFSILIASNAYYMAIVFYETRNQLFATLLGGNLMMLFWLGGVYIYTWNQNDT